MFTVMHGRLKPIAELSGLIAAILIFLAIIRVYVHYQYYHINIIPYLDFSEVILSVFNDLKVLWRLLVMLTGNLLLVPLIWGAVSFVVRKYQLTRKGRNPALSEEIRADLKEQTLFKRLLHRITYPNNKTVRRWLGIIGALIILNSILQFIKVWGTSIDDFTFYISSLGLSIGLFTIIWVAVNHFYKSAIIAALLLFFFIFILLGKHDPTLDRQNAESERWVLITVTDTIRTSDTFYLAGKTNHYYFLYASNSKTTSIIPAEKVLFSSVQSIKSDTHRLRDLIRREIRSFSQP